MPRPLRRLLQGVANVAGSPAFGTLAGLRLSRREQQQYDEYRAQQQAIADELVSQTQGVGQGAVEAAQGVSNQGLGLARRYFGGAEGRFASVLNPAEAGVSSLLGGYRALEQQGAQGYQSLLAGLQGMGQQEARDIRADYANLGASEQSRLASMGLTGTSAVSGAALGVQRGQTDALARLQERIRGETQATRLAGLESSLGLARERLGTQASGLEFLTGLRGQGLGYQDTATQNLLSSELNLGLLPSMTGIDVQEMLNRLRTEQIQFAPPYQMSPELIGLSQYRG